MVAELDVLSQWIPEQMLARHHLRAGERRAGWRKR